jgi:hypothetical protein
MRAALQPRPLFQAEWPKSLEPKASSLREIVLRILLLPLTIPQSIVRHLAFRIIIPGNFIQVAQLTFKAKGYEITKVKTPDGGEINGIFVLGKNPKKVVLFEGGNVERWENSLVHWYEQVEPTNASFFFLNPRSVGESSGPLNSQGYALDVYSAAEYLIQEKGIDPEDILFAGFSMGGANTARGAALIQEKYPDKKISALNINSFSSLEKEIYEIAGMIGYIASRLLGLDKDVKSAWDQLRGRKVILHAPKDPLIPAAAQLATVAGEDTEIIPLTDQPTHSPLADPGSSLIIQAAFQDLVGNHSLISRIFG